MKSALGKILPRAIVEVGKSVVYAGTARTCAVCGAKVRRFLTQGYGCPVLEELQVIGGMQKPDDECPICHASDRTRLVHLYTTHHSGFFADGNRVLHIAPEPGLAGRWSRSPKITYVPADLDRGRYGHLDGFIIADIQAAPFPDLSFDWIVCNHVLEHVPDDRKAMREIFRMLSPGGAAILQVPISLVRAVTDEDPTVSCASERVRRFGQRDHVRLYARDYYERLREVGFNVELWDPFAADPAQAKVLNLNPREKLTIARRPIQLD